VIGGGDPEVEGGLIGGMIYAGDPVVGAVRPVVAEETAASEFVVGNDEPVCRDAFVGNSIGMLLA